MGDLGLVAALLGGITLAVSLAAGWLRGTAYLPAEPVIVFLFGIAVGPAGLGVLRPADWGPPLAVIEPVARLTVALAVMSAALRLPADYFRRRAGSMAVLLGPGMAIMWLVSALVTDWLIGVPFWMAALVGAIVTPTDPVLAGTIVVGETAERHIPPRLRYLLSAEAGANDGAAYLFVALGAFMLGHLGDVGWVVWGLRTVLWEVLGAVVLGLLAGGGIGRIERWLSSMGTIDEISVFTVTVALTFAVLGVASLLGTVDILAVFVAGVGYNWQANPRDEAQEQKVEEVFSQVFTLPAFVLFGAVLPWAGWLALGWEGILLVVAILLARRLPMVLALAPFVRPLDRPAASGFVGWFGPIGIAAVLYAALATRLTGSATPWVLGSLVVAGSILVHGVTATALTLRYGRIGDEATWW